MTFVTLCTSACDEIQLGPFLQVTTMYKLSDKTLRATELLDASVAVLEVYGIKGVVYLQ